MVSDLDCGYKMLVREFYANAYCEVKPTIICFKSLVRGKEITYSPKLVMRYAVYGLGGPHLGSGGNFAVFQNSALDPQFILNELYFPGCMWEAMRGSGEPRIL